MKGVRLMDNSGIPLSPDGETVVKERSISIKPPRHSCITRSPPSIRLHAPLDGVAIL